MILAISAGGTGPSRGGYCDESHFAAVTGRRYVDHGDFMTITLKPGESRWLFCGFAFVRLINSRSADAQLAIADPETRIVSAFFLPVPIGGRCGRCGEQFVLHPLQLDGPLWCECIVKDSPAPAGPAPE